MLPGGSQGSVAAFLLNEYNTVSRAVVLLLIIDAVLLAICRARFREPLIVERRIL
jgi:hypothetical protein